MDSKIKFLSGFLYFSEDFEELKTENLFKAFKKTKRDEVEKIPLVRGNIFENPKAIGRQKNDVIIFELDYEENNIFNSSFRGFLYPDGSINGKIKYSLDAKSPDELFKGIYQFYQNGALVIFGNWLLNGSNCPVFIEFGSVRQIVKKKKAASLPIKKKVKKKK